MKRNLIAIAICSLGLATAAVAEPTLNTDANVVKFNAPEATSYQADVQQAGGRTMRDEIAPFTNP